MGNKSVEKVKRKANFRSIAVVLVLTVNYIVGRVDKDNALF